MKQNENRDFPLQSNERIYSITRYHILKIDFQIEKKFFLNIFFKKLRRLITVWLQSQSYFLIQNKNYIKKSKFFFII